MTSLAQRSHEEEQMDAADLDPAAYAALLTDLGMVNRLTLTARPTLAFLARALQGRSAFRLLDVGYGEGGMLRAIARWAGKRGIAADLVGIDLNPKSGAVASRATPPDLAIDYRTGDYAALASERFDIVLSSLVTHHMSDAQLIAFLRFMERHAARGWMVNDLHRHRLAYIGFPILAAAMRWHPIVRHDGKLSIARSFRRDEWSEMLDRAGITPGAARIVRRFPFKLCVERLR